MKRILRIIYFLGILLTPVSVFAQGEVIHSNKEDIKPKPKPKPKPQAPKLAVDGYSESLKLNFPDTGETRRLSVLTNQGDPTVTNTPYWISASVISPTSVTVNCDANDSKDSREGKFEIKAGELSVTVYVSQPPGVFSITKCDFRNSTNYSFGNSFYAADMRFLMPRLTYKGAGSPQSKTLYVKAIKSDGSLYTLPDSPSGYTYKQDVTFQPGENNSVELIGLGHSSQSMHQIGETKFEIYCDGKKLFTGTVDLKKKTNESTVLKVDGQTHVNSSISADGGEYTYIVSTDAQNWNIKNLPDFCDLTNQTSTSFRLNFKPNIGKERTDNFYVETVNQKVYINVKQAAGSGMKINRVWTSHNVLYMGQKGMTIHVDFNSEGLQGHTLKPCVFFFYENGSDLPGLYGSEYCTNGGQATVQKTTTTPYEYSRWEDFALFIPYSQLPLPPGNNKLKLYVKITDKTTDKWSDRSDDIHFTLTK